MVEMCELTSAGMDWAEVEAPSAYLAAVVVEMARPQRRAMKDRNSAAVAAATRVWFPVEMATQTGPVVVQPVAASLSTMAATVALPEQLTAIPVMRTAPMAVGMEGSPAGRSAPTAVGKAARAVPPAPSAATVVMMVEMEVPTSLLDQFLNL